MDMKRQIRLMLACVCFALVGVFASAQTAEANDAPCWACTELCQFAWDACLAQCEGAVSWSACEQVDYGDPCQGLTNYIVECDIP